MSKASLRSCFSNTFQMYEIWWGSWLGWHKGAGFHSSASHQTAFYSGKGKTFPTMISSSFSTAPFTMLLKAHRVFMVPFPFFLYFSLPGFHFCVHTLVRGYRCLEGRSLSLFRLGYSQLLGDEGGWIGKLRCKILWSTWTLQKAVLEAQHMILCSPGSASPPSAPQQGVSRPTGLPGEHEGGDPAVSGH